jgi:N-acetylmuramoyl-L-alanine amidase
VLKIDAQHRLVGDQVSQHATPNVGGSLRPRFLVMHYTAGRSCDSSVQSLCTQKPQGNASAHVVLGRDGRIVQLAPFNVVTWHAGVSQWNGLAGLNQHSIGIEIDNAGLMSKVGDRFVAWFGQPYPDDEVLLAEHKHGGGVRAWHTYTAVQIERALELAELLVAHYRLEDVLGHDDIARGRKVDPGPAFPLAALRSRALGRGDDAPPRYVVTADELNIRCAPDAQAAPVAPALRRGTELALLEPLDRWCRVEVVGTPDLEGWVNNRYIERKPARRAAARAAPKRKPPTQRATKKTSTVRRRR